MVLIIKKRLIIVGEVLLGALLAAIVTVVIIRSHSNEAAGQCAPLAERPPMSLGKLVNVASRDNKSLIAISGYLRFNATSAAAAAERFTFAPLTPIDNVTLAPGARASQELRLESKCMALTLTLARSGAVMSVDSIRVGARGDSAIKGCLISATGIYFGQDNSYVCYSEQILACHEHHERAPANEANGAQRPIKPKKVVDFVLEALRLEVNGNPAIIARGEFSKPPRFCF